MKIDTFTIDVDIFKKKIIDRKNAEKFLSKSKLILNLFYEEIIYLYDILEKTKVINRFYIKKPICIELYEYTNFLNVVRTKITNEIIPIVNEVFTKNNRQSPVGSFDINIKKELKIIHNMLKDPRNKVVAHRYTNKDGQYITIDELIRYLNKLTGKNLQDIKGKLFSIHDIIEEWIINNNRYIILANK